MLPSALTLTPALAVIIPTESILVTSSYVKTPPIEALPLTFNPVAVIIPVELISYVYRNSHWVL